MPDSLARLTTEELLAKLKQLRQRDGSKDKPIQQAEDKATLRQIAAILEKRRNKK